MHNTPGTSSDPIRQRLLQAAKIGFPPCDHHDVSTRRIADLAGLDVSLICYYFGSKGGLFEKMIRDSLQQLLDVLDGDMLATTASFADDSRRYSGTRLVNPELPEAVPDTEGAGPASRTRGERRVEALKQGGHVRASLDPDLLRISVASRAVEDLMDVPTDAAFLEAMDRFNGQLVAAGLAAAAVTEQVS